MVVGSSPVAVAYHCVGINFGPEGQRKSGNEVGSIRLVEGSLGNELPTFRFWRKTLTL